MSILQKSNRLKPLVNKWRMYPMKTIEEKFRQLPPNLQGEALNFINFLLMKAHSTTRKKYLSTG